MGKTLPVTHQIVNGSNNEFTQDQKGQIRSYIYNFFTKVLIQETVRDKAKRTEIWDKKGGNM